VEKTKK
jgi:hypothetical protein